MKGKLVTVIFSYNRAFQVDGVLRSLLRHAKDIQGTPISIIYKSDPDHLSSYQTLQKNYSDKPWIRFIPETNFHQNLVDVLDGFESVLFLVDDNIFVRDFSVVELLALLGSQSTVLGISLRLGKNTSYCYTLNQDQPLPVFIPMKPFSYYRFRWTDAESDFGYPLEVSSSIYRIKDILPLLQNQNVGNPNQLEAYLADCATFFRKAVPDLICPEASLTFCVPLNVVQSFAPNNRAGEHFSYQPEELRTRFEKGQRLDVEKYDGFTPNACHEEVPLLFYSPDAEDRENRLDESELRERFPLRKELQTLNRILEDQDALILSKNVLIKNLIFQMNWNYQNRDDWVRLAFELHRKRAVHGIRYLDELLAAQHEDWRFSSFTEDNWALIDRYLSGDSVQGPRVSVVMPVYNGERFLRAAIDSILHQTFTDFEFIIVDDGSSDRTESIIRSYDDPRIVYVKNENNSGIVKTLNRGLALAKGKYIARADADDISMVDRLKEQMEYMEANPNCTLYGSSMKIIDDVGHVRGEEIVPVSEEQIIRRLAISCSFVHPSIMMRKEIVLQVGGYLSDRPHAEDYDLWCRLSLNFNGDLANAEKSLIYYRANHEGVSQQNQKVQIESALLIGQRYLQRKTGINLSPSVYQAIYFAWLNGDWRYWREEYLPEAGPFFSWIRQAPIIQPRWKSFFHSITHTQSEKNGELPVSMKPHDTAVKFRVVAIIAAYNEADVIYHVIKDLVDQGIEVYFIDHHSTDDTKKIVSQFLGKGVIGIEDFPDDSGFDVPADVYSWRYILKRKEDIVKKLGPGWYLHMDADEFREAPWTGLSLYEGIQRVDNEGYNAIQFRLFDFKPVDNRFLAGEDVREYLPYYDPNIIESNKSQVKCWKYWGQDFSLWKSGGHLVEFEGRKIYPVDFILRHYPIRSQFHGEKKIFQERKQRWDKQERKFGWHIQYDDVKDEHFTFIEDRNDLLPWNGIQIRRDLLSSADNVEGLVSIIIPLFNQLDFTHQCLKAILKNTRYTPYEIILVNNASTDGTHNYINALANKYENIHIIENQENLLFAKACNQGAKVARGRYLLFLNNDTVVKPHWLENFVSSFRNTENVGIMGAKLLYPDDTVQHAGIEFFPDSHPIYRIWPLHPHRGCPADDPEVNRLKEVSAVTGACLFIEKDLFRAIGGFDEEYGMYFEDTDLCFKVQTTRKRILYNPEVVVYHHEGKSSRDQREINRLNIIAANRFYKKWRKRIGHLAFDLLTESVNDKFVILRNGINIDSKQVIYGFVNQIADHLASIIESIGPVYVHMGGIGDACLLLSTFYDRDPHQVILSIPNSIEAAKSFFSNFPDLIKVIFIPFPESPDYHALYRQIFGQMQTVLGMGTTPVGSYFVEWKEGINVFQKYGLHLVNRWTEKFRSDKLFEYQVVLNPCGSNKGMVGGKKNIIPPAVWGRLIRELNRANIQPIIIGTPDEAKDYPNEGKVLDKRSYDFGEQMKLIASSDLLIGADTWGKTFSALCGNQTIVFRSLRPKECSAWKDPAEHIFIDPWPTIQLVNTFNEFKQALQGVLKYTTSRQPFHRQMDRLILSGLEKINKAKTIYLYRSSGLGDVLMCLPLVKALQDRYPEKKVVLATSPIYIHLISDSPLVSNAVYVNHVNEIEKTESDVLFDLNQAKYGLASMHQIDAFLYAFGMQLDPTKKQVYFHDDLTRIQKVDTLLEDWQKKNSGKKLVVIHPGKGDPNRTWKLSYWNRLIDQVIHDGYSVAVIGNTQADSTRGVHDLKRADILNLINRLEPLDVVELCHRAELFISTDSGPIQLAGATNVAIVGIYSVVAGKQRLPYRNGIQGWNAVAVESDCPYRGCYRYMADDGAVQNFLAINPTLRNSIPQIFAQWCVNDTPYSCLTESITPAVVWKKAKQLLKSDQLNTLIELSSAEDDIRNGSYKGAKTACQKLFEKTNNQDALYGLALTHYLLDEKSLAESKLKSLVAKNPSHNHGLKLLDDLKKENKQTIDMDQYLPLFNDIDKTIWNQNLARRHYRLALINLAKEEYPDSLRQIKQSLIYNPSDKKVLKTLSTVLLKLGFREKAEKFKHISMNGVQPTFQTSSTTV